MAKTTPSKETMGQEPKNQEMTPQDTRKPANLRANAMPIDGFVLSVDGKFKTRYETATDAATAGAKLKQNYPVIQIAIYDASERTYSPIEIQDKTTDPARSP